MPPKLKYEGFGFCPMESSHHFRVTIPAGSQQEIIISEHFTYDEEDGSKPATLSESHDGQLKVILSRAKWNVIADEARVEFTRRLKRCEVKAGKWKTGVTPVSRPLGKELVLLCWAIEDADPATIPMAIRNWQGLAQEERWWLYTMTVATTGQAMQKGLGWRKALRSALADNPYVKGEGMSPRARRELLGHSQLMLNL